MQFGGLSIMEPSINGPKYINAEDTATAKSAINKMGAENTPIMHNAGVNRRPPWAYADQDALAAKSAIDKRAAENAFVIHDPAAPPAYAVREETTVPPIMHNAGVDRQPQKFVEVSKGSPMMIPAPVCPNQNSFFYGQLNAYFNSEEYLKSVGITPPEDASTCSRIYEMSPSLLRLCLPALNPTQMSYISDTNVASLDADQIRRLSISQLQMMTLSPMSVTQISAMSPDQAYAISPMQYDGLTQEQKNAIISATTLPRYLYDKVVNVFNKAWDEATYDGSPGNADLIWVTAKQTAEADFAIRDPRKDDIQYNNVGRAPPPVTVAKTTAANITVARKAAEEAAASAAKIASNASATASAAAASSAVAIASQQAAIEKFRADMYAQEASRAAKNAELQKSLNTIKQTVEQTTSFDAPSETSEEIGNTEEIGTAEEIPTEEAIGTAEEIPTAEETPTEEEIGTAEPMQGGVRRRKTRRRQRPSRRRKTKRAFRRNTRSRRKRSAMKKSKKAFRNYRT